MKAYLGAKIITAEPQDNPKVEPGNPAEPGYKVVYEDNYVSWSPKAVFEHAYRPVEIAALEMLIGPPPEQDGGERVTENIARVCHEANRAFCQSIGDHSQQAWDNAPVWQRNSCADGVRFHIENPNAGASASHENWMKFKLNEGWTHGPEKSEPLKTHPCLLPFHELPLQQQSKDYIFRAIVHAMR